MINFNLPKIPKWRHESPFLLTSAYIDDYSRHFDDAIQNLEMNLQEERLTKRRKKRKLH